ncbi:hypothetical protein PENTCL1PPCAC_7393, partial [Pristionchus entomophagus]
KGKSKKDHSSAFQYPTEIYSTSPSLYLRLDSRTSSCQHLLPWEESAIDNDVYSTGKKKSKRGVFSRLLGVFSGSKAERSEPKSRIEHSQTFRIDGVEPSGNCNDVDSVAEIEKRFDEFRLQMEEERQRFFEYQSVMEERLLMMGRRLSKRNAELSGRIEERDERCRRRHRCGEQSRSDMIAISMRDYNRMEKELNELKRFARHYRRSAHFVGPYRWS